MSNKNYHELIKNRIFIGGANDAKDVLENEKVDVILDLRAESPGDTEYERVHSPIVDDAEFQDESIRMSIDRVVKDYKDGKNVYFHCAGGSNRTGTVAIGTLLEIGQAKTIEEAEEIAQAARPKINVKPEMKAALKRLYPNA
ncbi:protein tyrosine phosphatase [Peribacillus saganii]|uniref:Protein tyrosine phosphatase n=1 Tax=Peribacillus saganii TaxID=2303992 RepID=A0A372LRF2_9BACI|nr:dual specificity protein phosphatase family protein [Peribacillus saganii]RFU70626.1 protein tyrosine phosphatase [Peribacillus saganii]